MIWIQLRKSQEKIDGYIMDMIFIGYFWDIEWSWMIFFFIYHALKNDITLMINFRDIFMNLASINQTWLDVAGKSSKHDGLNGQII